ncbi:MAG: acetate--CoA ligase family protein, partial [Tardiphaga sp.]
MLQAERCSPRPEAQGRIATKISVADFPAGSLDEAQAKALFARFGIPVVAEKIVSTPVEAQTAAAAFGSRVVLKVLSRDIAHKSDVGGVAVDLNVETIGERLLSMREKVVPKSGVRPERFLVQQMIVGGTELILGMHRDPLGTAVLLGMGGVA